MASSTESEAHRTLKRLALQWAQQAGYPCAAMEVRVPLSNFRADVAACRPERSPGSSRPGDTILFECKQSRADLLRDTAQSAPTFERLRQLYFRKSQLERLLKHHYPTLATGDSLFPEYESYALQTLEHRGYQSTLREIRNLQSRVMTKTKFERLRKYPCGNLFYLVIAEGILKEHEWPEGWGILARCGDTLQRLRLPVRHEASDSARLALLQNIALAGTRKFNREWGIEFPYSAVHSETT